MAVLSFWAQGDNKSLATCPWWRHGLAQAPTLNSRNNSQKELAIRCRLPPGCGSLEEAGAFRGRSGDSPAKLPIQFTGGVQGSCHLYFPVGISVA